MYKTSIYSLVLRRIHPIVATATSARATQAVIATHNALWGLVRVSSSPSVSSCRRATITQMKAYSL